MQTKTNGSNEYPVTQERAKKCFGLKLRAARESMSQKQQDLAERIKKSRVMIANYESGKASPEPNLAVKLAIILKQDPTEFLLLSNLQRASLQNTIDTDLLETVNKLLKKTKGNGISQSAAASLQTHLSLLDFRSFFTSEPMTIIVGDKREEEPQNAGDLFVFSASTVDDRWLPSLKLHPDTEKISDKVMMTAGDEWLKEHLGNRNLFCIGSPASNLFARKYNNYFLFRFAISREAQKKWEEIHEQIHQPHTQAYLLNFHERHREDLKQRMRLFKPPGFIDFNYSHLRLGMDLSYGKDFAVVSLGRNPFAEPDAPYFAVLAAGVHHPGTAHAVKFLSNPEIFEKHPFGGILEIDVPSKDADVGKIEWYNKVQESNAYWHTVGVGDSLEYTPNALLERLQKCMQKIKKSEIISDVIFQEDEIKGHIELIEKLAAIKKTLICSSCTEPDLMR